MTFSLTSVVLLIAGTGLGAGLGGLAFGYRGAKNLVTARTELSRVQDEIAALEAQRKGLMDASHRLRAETAALAALKQREDTIEADVARLQARSDEIEREIMESHGALQKSKAQLAALINKIDLYQDIDDAVSVGHFSEPEYLYETSERFTEEIRSVRERQKDMIKSKTAVDLPSDQSIVENDRATAKVLENQASLMITAYNLECDLLIGKVRPSTLSRTLERIEKLAESLDKKAASLHCGISPDYTALKYEECVLHYQYQKMKEEEEAEQRAIREQMREEAKAQKEYERAEREAEAEELRLLQKVQRAREMRDRRQLEGDALREAQERIDQLEAELADAQDARQRAQAMAELTRRGFVYIISNVGSFGPEVYKIGLTRRLDPMDRVNELGDASVPFPFDVHAMVYVEDAPGLEAALHRKFNHRRVNTVNRRKEFFRVSLDEIRVAVEETVGEEVEFRTTAKAEEYRESRRFRAEA